MHRKQVAAMETEQESQSSVQQKPQPTRFGFLQRRVAVLAEVFALLSTVAVVAGVFGKTHYLLDLASHFRIQATFVIVVSTVLLLVLKRRTAAFTGIVGTYLFFTLLPFWQPLSSDASREYRLVALNVLKNNPHHDKVIDLLVETDPDFIVLQEVDDRWIAELHAALQTNWPYRKLAPRDNNFGIAIWSKVDWEDCRILEFTDGTDFSLPSIDAKFRTGNGTSFRLIATHLLPPMSDAAWQIRNKSLKNLADAVKEGDQQATIVTGDFNCTCWSYWFRKFLNDTDLRNSSYGHGLAITWRPVNLAIASLPIDHVLAGEKIQIVSRSVGSEVGSDHRAVIVDFAIGHD